MLYVIPPVSHIAFFFFFFFIWLSEWCSDWNLKYDTNEHSTKQNRFPDTEQTCGSEGEGEEEKDWRGWDWRMQTVTYGMDEQ